MFQETTKPIAKAIDMAAFLRDPYPIYRQFLDAGPVHFVALGAGFQAVFSYSLVSSLLRDPRFSSRRTGSFMLTIPPEQRSNYEPLLQMLGHWMLFMDPPQHSRLRKLMNEGFSPAVAEILRPQVDSIVDEMLEEIEPDREIEFMSRLAHPFPARVIAKLLGIPASMEQDLIHWSNAIAVMLGNPHRTAEQCTAAQNAALALKEFFREAVALRRNHPGTDLISLLLQIEADGGCLTEDELLDQSVLLLFGGHETTRNLIGNGVHTLLQNPEQLDRLRENPELIRPCVEELLRYQSPIQFIARMAKEDLSIEGAQVRAGDTVMLMIGAANRDPTAFDRPDAFDIARRNNRHLAFGAATHFCIGNQIARLEAQAFILKFLQRFPAMQFTDTDPQRAPNAAFRGFKSLPLRLA